MTATALWRRLDMPGHDAVLLIESGDGGSLSGTAVYRHDAGPASVHDTVSPAIGSTVDIPVCWFDVDFETLVELPQTYTRRDETTYDYVAPSVPFEGPLVFAENGFARRYVDVWVMED